MSVDLIEHNPAYKMPALSVLAACEQHRPCSRQELEESCANAWQPSWRQQPGSIIDMLERSGALEEALIVDGKPYNGSLAQLQLDMDVPEDAAWSCSMAVTELGQRIMQDYSANATITALYESKPQYRNVFDSAVKACARSQGCTRQELEEAVNAHPELKPNPQTGQTQVYAQYFIDALETAGAISWDGRWKTTPEGRALLAS
ncbi:MAG: hypothetical protein ACI36V_02630 [Coriobacteriales bacterium]